MSPEQAKELGRYIRSVRTERNMSVFMLERESEVTRSTLSRLERGDFRSTTPATMSRIARALDIDLAPLYERAGIPVPDLPAFTPYLRTKYDQMPSETIEQIERYAAKLASQHGINLDGPAPGEDEAPEP